MTRFLGRRVNSNVWAPKPGKLRLVARSIRGALALVLAGGPAFTQGRADGSRPQTVPLWGASYPPDIGLLLCPGRPDTRYGFRGRPPTTPLLAEAAYATACN